MPEISPSKYTVHAGWDDVPHLTEQTKRELEASTPPYLRKARTKGLPGLGAGAIYPVDLDDGIYCTPFPIPEFWEKAYGMDVGWKRTAAVWLTQNPSDGVMYAYAEYYRGRALPLIHSEAIQTRGRWIKGAIDPASRASSQSDGKKLFVQYKDAGLHLRLANNAVTAGIDHVWTLLSTRRLRFFNTLSYLPKEYEMYHRDEDGVIVKENDHLLDALRYVIMTWDKVKGTRPNDEHWQMATHAADEIANY